MIRLDRKARKAMRFFKLEQRLSQKKIWLASFLGVYLHILLDSFLYADVKPFFPLAANPFYRNALLPSSEVYGLCAVSFVIGVVLYAAVLAGKWKLTR